MHQTGPKETRKIDLNSFDLIKSSLQWLCGRLSVVQTLAYLLEIAFTERISSARHQPLYLSDQLSQSSLTQMKYHRKD